MSTPPDGAEQLLSFLATMGAEEMTLQEIFLVPVVQFRFEGAEGCAVLENSAVEGVSTISPAVVGLGEVEAWVDGQDLGPWWWEVVSEPFEGSYPPLANVQLTFTRPANGAEKVSRIWLEEVVKG